MSNKAFFNCQCNNGTPVGKDSCKKENDEHCKSCDVYFHLVDGNKNVRDENYCKTNKCKCEPNTCQCSAGCVKITKNNKQKDKCSGKDDFWDDITGKCYTCSKQINVKSMDQTSSAPRCKKNLGETCVICTKQGTWLNNSQCVPWTKCNIGQNQLINHLYYLIVRKNGGPPKGTVL